MRSLGEGWSHLTAVFGLAPFLSALAAVLLPLAVYASDSQSLKRSASASEWETMVVSVIVNTETKGEFFVNRTVDGDFLMKTGDLRAMGFKDIAGKTTEIEGEQYVSLKSVEGIQFVLNEKTLSLEITAKPSLLSKKVIDFMPTKPAKVYYPKDSAVFLNYRLDYNAGNSFRFQSLDLANELGARTGDILFLTDSLYMRTPAGSQFVRLMSSITYDRRNDLQRLVAGDFFSNSGNLGSGVDLGGISFSKVYSIDPYFIRYPLADFRGFAALPSSLEVYLNGTRIRSEKLSPGEFDLNNIFYYGGANSVNIVIKDAFGREQIVRYPFYFTDILLRQGLHEYSYNVGFIRNNLGLESNNYSGLAFSGFHRYGVSDSLTLGISSEGGKGNYNLGPQASLLLGYAGVMTLSLSGSTDEGGRQGLAGALNYGYQDRKVSAQAFFKGFTRDYAAIGNAFSTDRTKYEAGLGLGFSSKEFGSASVAFDQLVKYIGQDSRSIAATYTRVLFQKVQIFVSFRRTKQITSSNDLFFGITYYPRPETSVSTSYEKTGDMDVETVQLQKNPPIGEGIGYRVSAGRASSPAGETETLDPFFQYNGRFGIYTAEYNRQFSGVSAFENYNLSASGGITYIDGTLGFTRPVNDSFGLVRVGSVEGVRVYENNQEIGRTDSSGKVLVPDLGSYYDNQVSISDKDVPMDYTIKEVVKYVSPPLRSGSLINFEVTKFQAITGKLKIKIDGKVLPAEYVEVKMKVQGAEMTFPTGKGGEFYFENIKPGTYSASFDYKEKRCSFDIIIPRSGEIIIDLGEITCEEKH
jgi:outer membrane usher protein